MKSSPNDYEQDDQQVFDKLKFVMASALSHDVDTDDTT